MTSSTTPSTSTNPTATAAAQPTATVQEFYDYTINPKATTLGNQVHLDFSNEYCTTKIVTPYEGASDTTNGLNGAQTKMRYNVAQGTEIMDMDSHYLKICFRVSNAAGTGAVVTSALSPFYVGDAINGVNMWVDDDTSKPVINIQQNFAAFWRAMIISNLSNMEINNSNYIAGPAWNASDIYYLATQPDYGFLAAPVAVSAATTNAIDALPQQRIDSAANALADLKANLKLAFPPLLADSYFNGPASFLQSQGIREKITFGYGDHTTDRYVSVPLRLLAGYSFGGNYPLCLKSFDVVINWNNSFTAPLERHQSAVMNVFPTNLGDAGKFVVRSVKMYVKSIILSKPMQDVVAQKKEAGHIDNISYLTFDVRSVAYTGPNNEILLPNIRNLQSVMIMRPCTDLAGDVAGNHGERTLVGHAQFCFGAGVAGSNLTGLATQSDQNAVSTVATMTRPTSFQMNYIRPIPDVPLDLNDNLMGLYEEYERTSRNYNGKEPCIPYEVFCRTAPIIWMAVKDAPAEVVTSDLRLYLNVGTTAQTFFVCMQVLKSFRILPKGEIISMTI